MRYIKTYEQSQLTPEDMELKDKLLNQLKEYHNNLELTKLIELNLEDNELFEIEAIKIVSSTVDLDTMTALCIEQIFTNSTDQTLIDLRNKFLEQKSRIRLDVDDMSDEEYDALKENQEQYGIALDEYEKYMKDSTTKLIEKLAKKYDFKILVGPRCKIEFFELSPSTANTDQVYYYQCAIRRI